MSEKTYIYDHKDLAAIPDKPEVLVLVNRPLLEYLDEDMRRHIEAGTLPERADLEWWHECFDAAIEGQQRRTASRADNDPDPRVLVDRAVLQYLECYLREHIDAGTLATAGDLQHWADGLDALLFPAAADPEGARAASYHRRANDMSTETDDYDTSPAPTDHTRQLGGRGRVTAQ